MRIVIALGGNALLKRGEPMTAEVQRGNVSVAARMIAPLARDHEIVVTHGNGPQVGLLALQAACYRPVEPYPLDVLDAQTEGMIGYMIEQELAGNLPASQPCATILTMVEVDPEDPAFLHPSKFVGPPYTEGEKEKVSREKGWTFGKDGDSWRRVVPSPLPRRIVEIQPIRWLLSHGVIVICAGGGGIPVVTAPGKRRVFEGVEAVIDKDRASALLAEELGADLLVMATDVEGVFIDWNTPSARRIHATTPEQLREHRFEAGSMGPKVEAACSFVDGTGGRAAIGALPDIRGLVSGDTGTQVTARKPTGRDA
ncbi:MAG: Carbamate kinase [Methanoregulaceae archaeon PtaB.Bin056]|jgi:carbamate kinase|nr:MAG: Carbamate kinase [Methanoregulaceae archaeon PtaB.Bin056]